MATHQVFSVPQQAIGQAVVVAPMPKVALFLLSATHDPRIAARCRRVVEIVDGRIQSDTGPRATV